MSARFERISGIRKSRRSASSTWEWSSNERQPHWGFPICDRPPLGGNLRPPAMRVEVHSFINNELINEDSPILCTASNEAERTRRMPLMALWRRRPEEVIHHSDQGCQYTSRTKGVGFVYQAGLVVPLELPGPSAAPAGAPREVAEQGSAPFRDLLNQRAAYRFSTESLSRSTVATRDETDLGAYLRVKWKRTLSSSPNMASNSSWSSSVENSSRNSLSKMSRLKIKVRSSPSTKYEKV